MCNRQTPGRKGNSQIVRTVSLLMMATMLGGVGEPADRPFVVGHLEAKSLGESSGVVESRKHPGVYWTHNDSGNEPILYAIRRDGSLINQFPVHCIALDWEDIAIDDDGHLFLGDIGNNGNVRSAIGVMMLDEPDPNVAPEPKHRLRPLRQWLLTFHDNQRMDCESLFVWKGSGYLIRKSVDRSPTTLWRFSLEKGESQEIAFVATLPVNAVCTGADLSRDGDRLAVMSGNGPILISGIKGDLNGVEKCDAVSIGIEPRTNEGICFTKDGLLGTSEKRDVYFFPFDAFNKSSTSPPKP